MRRFANLPAGLVCAMLLAACSKPPPRVTVAPPPAASPTQAKAPGSATPTPAPAPVAPPAPRPPTDTPGLSRAGELNLLVGEFISQTGQPPKSLEELVAKKFIARIPDAGPGKKYALKVIDQSRAEVVVVNK